MRRVVKVLVLLFAFVGMPWTATAKPPAGSEVAAPNPSTEPFLLGPPPGAAPVVADIRLDLQDINDFGEEGERFEFAAVMTTQWLDPRQAFDPAYAGADEKDFQGGYEFDEISPWWYPQVVLVNESALYQKSRVVLRIPPDGASTLVETINAAAEIRFDMRRYPLDHHRLEAARLTRG
jgi:hypothetical protein